MESKIYKHTTASLKNEILEREMIERPYIGTFLAMTINSTNEVACKTKLKFKVVYILYRRNLQSKF